MKRFIALLLALVLPLTAMAEDTWLNDTTAPDASDTVTDKTVYDAADAAGNVVNATDPGAPTQQESIVYSFSPLDVVLVLDVSGSMDARDPSTGKSLLNYAQEAASAFSETLLSINPASRIALVTFDDNVYTNIGYTGHANQQALSSAIQSLQPMGSTNTGGGYAQALTLMQDEALPARRLAVLMLTDGQANAGAGNPSAYAIQQGRACAELSTVYTIGLVGGLSGGAASETRRILNAGYERRYFEVDFDSVASGGISLAGTVSLLAMQLNAAGAIDSETEETYAMDVYQLSVGPGMDVRITSSDGQVLSSFPGENSESAAFGSLTQVDGQKFATLFEGDYTLELQGRYAAEGSYTLKKIQGVDMKETILLQGGDWSHESMQEQIDLSQGNAAVTELGWNPADPGSRDDSGAPTGGLTHLPDAITKGNMQVQAAPASAATRIQQLNKGDHVRVLAVDRDKGYWFIRFTDENGLHCRGWIPLNTLQKPNGYYPDMHWLSGTYTANTTVKAHRAPDAASAAPFEITKGSQLTLMHAERDDQGQEWAYVSLPGRKYPVYAYVPASCLEGWETHALEGFQMGATPYTEVIDFPRLDIAPGQDLNIYSAPDTSSFRGAKGKAEVSTSGGLYAMGWVNNHWLLVQYGTSIGNRRVGYIKATSFKVEVPDCPQIIFTPEDAVITAACILTDDPKNASEQILSLNPGDKVTWLSEYTYQNPETLQLNPLVYVQTKVNGKVVRAFVPADCIERADE